MLELGRTAAAPRNQPVVPKSGQSRVAAKGCRNIHLRGENDPQAPHEFDRRIAR